MGYFAAADVAAKATKMRLNPVPYTKADSLLLAVYGKGSFLTAN